MRVPTVTLLLCLTLSLLPAAHSQTCADRMHRLTPPAHTVSVADLRTPPQAREHYERARLALEQGNLPRFDQESAKALAIAPRFAGVYLLQAIRELHDQQYAAALTATTTAREIQPTLPYLHVITATALTQLRRFDDAVAELEQADAEEAASWQLRYERARAETGRHNIPAALHWSELAVAAAPAGCTEARIIRANAFQIAGRPADAVVELEAYLATDQQGSKRAEVLAVLEQTRRALKAQPPTLAQAQAPRLPQSQTQPQSQSQTQAQSQTSDLIGSR